MVDVVVAAEAIDDRGQMRSLAPAELGLTYRHSGVPDSWIFTRAVLKAEAGDPQAILARIQDIRAQREASQPVRARTGGSTFANPPGAKAWELIDKAGLRGFQVGGAQVSEKHCNFLINTGEATAADIEGLGEEIRRRVRDMSAIELRWEIRIIGEAA
jgi:UDP-N-acetylmuramate dehydrogenase